MITKKTKTMKLELLKTKKITKATLKSFVANANNLYVESLSSFDGMIDGIRYEKETKMIPVTKDNAIGIKGIWLTHSKNWFKIVESENHYGIEVSNCCGCAILWTNKN